MLIRWLFTFILACAFALGWELYCLKNERDLALNRPRLAAPVKQSEDATLARKNKNPLNVKCPPGKPYWVGQIGRDEFGHAKFRSWEYGVRAASFVLRSYAKKHNIETVEGIVNRFATGNRRKYAAFLAERLGVKTNEKINLVKRMPELLRAMSRFESGEDFPDTLFAPYDVLAKL